MDDIKIEPYTCSKVNATVYKIRLKKEGTYSGWADITIEEWDRGGSFKCISDYGDYSYMWGSIGDECLREFLLDLNKDYFMGKVRGNSRFMFDAEANTKKVFEEIVNLRRNNDISKEEARESWDDLQFFSLELTDSQDLWFERFMGTIAAEKIYGYDPHGMPDESYEDPTCVMFWERIWPLVCDVWKKELEEEKVEAVRAEQGVVS